MILILIAIVATLLWRVIHHSRQPTLVKVAGGVDRALQFLVESARTAPLTFVYLAILTVTTWVLLGVSTELSKALLLEHSTNLDQLQHNPIKVLIRSAFWLSDAQLLVWVILFGLVLVPAERWLGSRRFLTVFVVGHIGATLIVAAGLSYAVRTGIVGAGERNTIDVGVSYGFTAVAGVLTYRFNGSLRWLWASACLALLATIVVLGPTFTDYGHLAALLLGLSCYPIARRTPAARRELPPWPNA